MPEVDLEIRRVADVADTILSPAEAERASRFRFEPARRRYIAARTILRQLAAARLGIEPAAVSLDADDRGKPFVAGRPFELNVSHSGDYLAIAFSEAPVGIDIEQISERTPVDAIAGRFFPPDLVRYLDALRVTSRRREFFRLWTTMEAAIKADGAGVWSSIGSMELVSPSEDPTICRVNGRAWRVGTVEIAPGYAGAVATLV